LPAVRTRGIGRAGRRRTDDLADCCAAVHDGDVVLIRAPAIGAVAQELKSRFEETA
jgi:hypothetical protein